jgi:hypothetical protein
MNLLYTHSFIPDGETETLNFDSEKYFYYNDNLRLRSEYRLSISFDKSNGETIRKYAVVALNSNSNNSANRLGNHEPYDLWRIDGNEKTQAELEQLLSDLLGFKTGGADGSASGSEIILSNEVSLSFKQHISYYEEQMLYGHDYSTERNGAVNNTPGVGMAIPPALLIKPFKANVQKLSIHINNYDKISAYNPRLVIKVFKPKTNRYYNYDTTNRSNRYIASGYRENDSITRQPLTQDTDLTIEAGRYFTINIDQDYKLKALRGGGTKGRNHWDNGKQHIAWQYLHFHLALTIDEQTVITPVLAKFKLTAFYYPIFSWYNEERIIINYKEI